MQDRLFFFAGYERNRVRQTTQDNLAFLPTDAMLAGDFTDTRWPPATAAPV